MSTNSPYFKELEAGIEKAKAVSADPDVVQKISIARDMFKGCQDFTLDATTGHSDTLAKIHHETLTRDWQADFDQGKTPWLFWPLMSCGRLQRQFLKSLVSIQRAKRILEVGLFTGYGAMSMAEALPADGELVSLEVCESLKHLVEELVKDSYHAKKIRVEVGPALETMKRLDGEGEKFDMMFLDGDKKDYIDLVKLAFDGNLLSDGGTVLIDNAYIHGAAYCPSDNNHQLAHELLETVKTRAHLHRVMLPMNDGILMIRRMKDVERDSA